MPAKFLTRYLPSTIAKHYHYNHLFDIRGSKGSFFVEVLEDAAWCCHALRENFEQNHNTQQSEYLRHWFRSER